MHAINESHSLQLATGLILLAFAAGMREPDVAADVPPNPEPVTADVGDYHGDGCHISITGFYTVVDEFGNTVGYGKEYGWFCVGWELSELVPFRAVANESVPNVQSWFLHPQEHRHDGKPATLAIDLSAAR